MACLLCFLKVTLRIKKSDSEITKIKLLINKHFIIYYINLKPNHFDLLKAKNIDKITLFTN